jgi:methanogenic corrinoid protein MtbC1
MMTKETPEKPRHPIQVAARRSGLSPDVIRVWERRYDAVSPARSETNRRLYSDEDVERLQLLGQVTRAGRRIGDVASLSLEELRETAAADRQAAEKLAPSAVSGARSRSAKRHLVFCLDAVEQFDASGLEEKLADASIDLAPVAFMEQLLMPFMETIGERWKEGSLRVAHEHMASAVVRSYIGSLNGNGRLPAGAPDIIVATPAGQRHELGALMAAIAASSDGWRVTYLGPDLPAEDIVAAAKSRKAMAVALSIVYPADDSRLNREIKRIRSQLADGVALFAGGASASSYSEIIEEVGAQVMVDVSIFREELRKLRS